MKLSTRSRYSVRLVFELAKQQNDTPVFLKDIAKNQNLSEKYLSKLVIPLKSAGIINSARGAHGGYVLTKEATKITLRDIVLVSEGDMTLVDCGNNETLCANAELCPTRDIWKSLENLILNYLQNITIAELVEKYNTLCTEQFVYHI